MEYAWHDLVGNLGVALIVFAYLGLQIGRLDGRTVSYSLINGIGATLILVSLRFNFNLSSFVIEIFWLAISLVGMVLALRNRNRQEP